MLLDVIATAILAVFLLVPLVNVVTAAVIGATLYGPAGAAGGVAIAILITALEIWIADLFGWRDLSAPAIEACAGADAALIDPHTEDVVSMAAAVATAAFSDRVVTGSPTHRRSQMHARETAHAHPRRVSATAGRRSGTR
jgi:hypothetical protein